MALDQNYKGLNWLFSNDDSYSQQNESGMRTAPQFNYALMSQNEDALRKAGYSGNLYNFDSEGGMPTATKDFIDWADQNNIVSGQSNNTTKFGGGNQSVMSMFNQGTGAPLGTPQLAQSNDSFAQMLLPIMLMAGPMAAAAFGGGAVGGAASGALFGGVSGGAGALDTGGDIFSGALKGAAMGGAGGGIAGSLGTGAGQFNVGDALGFTDPNLVKFANSAAGTLGKSALTGSNPTQGLIGNALSAGGAAVGGMFDNQPAPSFNLPSQGGSMNDSGDYGFGNFDPNSGNDFTSPWGLGLAADPQSQDDWLKNLFSNYQAPNPFLDASAGGATPPSGGGIVGGVGGIIKSLLGGGGGAAASGGDSLMKSILPILGGLAGAASGGSQQVSSVKMDPRMDQYVYGSGVGDPSSLLGAAQKQFQANPSGINPTMQQGLDMQRSALTDPAYAQSYQQMRGLGSSLMSQPVAGNPFTAPPQPMSQAGGPGGLLGNNPIDRAKALMARGRGLI